MTAEASWRKVYDSVRKISRSFHSTAIAYNLQVTECFHAQDLSSTTIPRYRCNKRTGWQRWRYALLENVSCSDTFIKKVLLISIKFPAMCATDT